MRYSVRLSRNPSFVSALAEGSLYFVHRISSFEILYIQYAQRIGTQDLVESADCNVQLVASDSGSSWATFGITYEI